MRGWALGGAATLALSLVAREGAAYTIGSAFTHSCHERMSATAVALYLESLGNDVVVSLPANDAWKVAAQDIRRLLADTDRVAPLLETDEGLFIAFSMLSGLRFPDTYGYSVTDVNAARRVHGDLTPQTQYAHALRAATDEGDSGDLSALNGVRDTMDLYVSEMVRLLDAPPQQQLLESYVYLDHYGRTEIEVWGPAWLLGQGLHALQDSFSHSIRSEDGAHVLHVLNFVDAYRGDLHHDDGLAHSTGMDDCDREEVSALVVAARDRSLALVSAVEKLRAGDGGQALLAGLSDCAPDRLGDAECGWFAYYPQCKERIERGEGLEGTCCSRETRFCDSPLLHTIEETPTEPYVGAALGCQSARCQTSSGLSALWGLLLVAFGGFRRRRWKAPR